MHRTATRLPTTAAAVAALAPPAHSSWTAPANAARATCAYQHNQTDPEYEREPTSIEYPNLVRRSGFVDYTDDSCMG